MGPRRCAIAQALDLHILKRGQPMPNAKEEVRRILDALPEDATWDDVQYSIYVRERVERGRIEAREQKVVDQDEVETRMKRWLGE
jgi:hypothetical protein